MCSVPCSLLAGLSDLHMTLEYYVLQNASLKTETNLLKDQLKQLENQNTSLNNQMLALQRHTTTLQEQNTALHTGTAKQQVNKTVDVAKNESRLFLT